MYDVRKRPLSIWAKKLESVRFWIYDVRKRPLSIWAEKSENELYFRTSYIKNRTFRIVHRTSNIVPPKPYIKQCF
jgi:hypothetical protein